jgi:hypothetical protein
LRSRAAPVKPAQAHGPCRSHRGTDLVARGGTGRRRQIPLDSVEQVYSHDFDRLAPLGSSSNLPSGWALAEAGTGANGSYTASSGALTLGDTYSYGEASTERALGTLLDTANIPTIGARFRNRTGAPISWLSIRYAGEQWRRGNDGG